MDRLRSRNLRVRAYPSTNPNPGGWNDSFRIDLTGMGFVGSIWSFFYEFFCLYINDFQLFLHIFFVEKFSRSSLKKIFFFKCTFAQYSLTSARSKSPRNEKATAIHRPGPVAIKSCWGSKRVEQYVFMARFWVYFWLARYKRSEFCVTKYFSPENGILKKNNN